MKEGSSPTQHALIACPYAPNFQITHLKCDNKFLVLRTQELERDRHTTSYKISASFRPDAPAGTWQTEIWISTNDTDTPRTRVPVTVEVEPQAATR